MGERIGPLGSSLPHLPGFDFSGVDEVQGALLRRIPHCRMQSRPRGIVQERNAKRRLSKVSVSEDASAHEANFHMTWTVITGVPCFLQKLKNRPLIAFARLTIGAVGIVHTNGRLSFRDHDLMGQPYFPTRATFLVHCCRLRQGRLQWMNISGLREMSRNSPTVRVSSTSWRLRESTFPTLTPSKATWCIGAFIAQALPRNQMIMVMKPTTLVPHSAQSDAHKPVAGTDSDIGPG